MDRRLSPSLQRHKPKGLFLNFKKPQIQNKNIPISQQPPLNLAQMNLYGSGAPRVSDKEKFSLRDRVNLLPDTSPCEDVKSKRQREKFYRTVSEEKVGLMMLQPNTEPFEFVVNDLEDQGEIGRGAFGSVNKMVHKQTGRKMAVKRIRTTCDEAEQKKLLMDLDVVMRSSDCSYIVRFYGAVFWEGDCWICMELMCTSLDNLYKHVYPRDRIPEVVLGQVALSTLKALDYLKETLNIIHRDVKPSNILVNTCGAIKLCDFSISGQLIDSIAKTRDVGCRPYMAPERIEPTMQCYDVRSDVWSLGISLIELSTGEFPFKKWKNVFEQLSQVVNGEPPKLNANHSCGRLIFSQQYVDFVNLMTTHDATMRPKYHQLLSSSYITELEGMKDRVTAFVAQYLSRVLASMTQEKMDLS